MQVSESSDRIDDFIRYSPSDSWQITNLTKKACCETLNPTIILIVKLVNVSLIIIIAENLMSNARSKRILSINNFRIRWSLN